MKARVCTAFVVALSAACGNDSPSSHDDLKTSIEMADWVPLNADETFEGKSLREWLVEWKRWGYSQTTCDSAAFDPDGSLCGLHQDPDSPVFFLDHSPDDTQRTKCRVPSGKAVGVPIAVAFQDNLGVDEPYSDSELEKIVAEAFASMRDMEIEADGVRFEAVLAEYAIEPMAYTFDLPPAPNWYSCNGIDGIAGLSAEPGWLAGYFMLFTPPKPGRHELSYGGVQTFDEEEYYVSASTRFVVE